MSQSISFRFNMMQTFMFFLFVLISFQSHSCVGTSSFSKDNNIFMVSTSDEFQSVIDHHSNETNVTISLKNDILITSTILFTMPNNIMGINQPQQQQQQNNGMFIFTILGNGFKLDGGESMRVIRVTGPSSLLNISLQIDFHNLTVQNGNGVKKGAGISIFSNVIVNLYKCNVIGNIVSKVGGGGGGIYAENSVLNVYESKIINNSAR